MAFLFWNRSSYTEFAGSILPPSGWNRRRHFRAVLSDSNALRRHFRVAGARDVRRASSESDVDFAPLRFGPRRGGKTSKSERIPFAGRHEGFREPAVSH